MRRFVRVSLLGAVCTLCLAGAAAAATFAVTKTADTADGVCSPADCSLREAVIAANADAGADTILIPPGTYTLTREGAGETAADTGDLDILYPVSIVGAGRDATTVDANGIDRAFVVRVATERVEFRALKIRNGTTTGLGGGVHGVFFSNIEMTDVALSDNTAAAGGGIYVNQRSRLVLRRCLIENNASTTTSYVQAGGGGVRTESADEFTAIACVIRDNTAAYDGGGLNLSGAAATIRDTEFEGNSAGGGGGAMLSSSHPTDVSGSLFFDNSAQVYGGAIVQYGGGATTLTVTNSTFAANSVLTAKGDNNGELGGGAVALNRFGASNVYLTNVTLASNTTLPFPGVPNATGSALTCSDCMDKFRLRNVIASGSAAVPLCQGKFVGAMDTLPISLGGNVDTGTTCGFSDPSDQSGVSDAKLAPLTNNGGLTRTRALQAGSPALGAGAMCPTNDQRGFVRGTEMCDSGAYEALTPASATAFSCGGSYEGVAAQIEYVVEDLLPDAAADVGDVVYCLGGIAGNA